MALARSIVRQGILGDSRASYWKFLFDAAVHHTDKFGTAVILAIMGHHFQTLTREVCRSGHPGFDMSQQPYYVKQQAGNEAANDSNLVFLPNTPTKVTDL